MIFVRHVRPLVPGRAVRAVRAVRRIRVGGADGFDVELDNRDRVHSLASTKLLKVINDARGQTLDVAVFLVSEILGENGERLQQAIRVSPIRRLIPDSGTTIQYDSKTQSWKDTFYLYWTKVPIDPADYKLIPSNQVIGCWNTMISAPDEPPVATTNRKSLGLFSSNTVQITNDMVDITCCDQYHRFGTLGRNRMPCATNYRPSPAPQMAPVIVPEPATVTTEPPAGYVTCRTSSAFSDSRLGLLCKCNNGAKGIWALSKPRPGVERSGMCFIPGPPPRQVAPLPRPGPPPITRPTALSPAMRAAIAQERAILAARTQVSRAELSAPEAPIAPEAPMAPEAPQAYMASGPIKIQAAQIAAPPRRPLATSFNPSSAQLQAFKLRKVALTVNTGEKQRKYPATKKCEDYYDQDDEDRDAGLECSLEQCQFQGLSPAELQSCISQARRRNAQAGGGHSTWPTIHPRPSRPFYRLPHMRPFWIRY